MDYAELSATQYRRTRKFSKAHTDVMAMYCDAEHDLKESQAENAKLRELVRDLWLQLLNAYDHKEVDEFADRMRELGVAE